MKTVINKLFGNTKELTLILCYQELCNKRKCGHNEEGKKTLLRYIVFKLFSFFPSTHINFYIKSVHSVVPPVGLKCHAALL